MAATDLKAPTLVVHPSPKPLSDPEYAVRTAAVLGSLEASCDQWLQADVVDIDTHRTGGLLELTFPDGSKVVINAQPPLHELWLAARSGGYHFKFSQGLWRDTKSGREFFQAVSEEASLQAKQPLVFQAPDSGS